VACLTLLAILLVWMSWSKGLGDADPHALRVGLAIPLFLGGYVLLILALRAWSTLASRRALEGRSASLYRLQSVMHWVARPLVPAWLGVGIYLLGWGRAVQAAVPWLYRWPSQAMHLEFPQTILGILPAMLAWIGLWWSHHPAEHSLREQSVLANLNDDLPIHAPPTFRQTLSAKFRLQILFTLVPVLFILILRDLTAAGFALAGIRDARGMENAIMIPATGLVLLFAPELLRRVLHTEPLADSPLRRRLEQICRDAGLKYRQILLWRTDSTMANAAVMGLFPRVRYVMLSDLLLESMTDSQIEAVFAHEVGHVVHKHLMWFGFYALAAILFMLGPADQVMGHIQHWYEGRFSRASWEEIEGLVGMSLMFGSFVLAVGFLSPRFERQADVFAARTMQRIAEESGVVIAHADANPGNPATAFEAHGLAKIPPQAPVAPTPSHVGEAGAGLFASALYRVAVINHIPVTARNWSHPSIAQRMRALTQMSADPAHTRRFDYLMKRLYASLIACLCTFGIWAALIILRGGPAEDPGSPGRPAGAAPVLIPPPAVHAGH
jgi:STE24 endopeptidase